MPRITEAEIAQVVIEILQDRPHGRASIAGLVEMKSPTVRVYHLRT